MTDLLDAASRQVDSVVDKSLRRIGEFYDADRVIVATVGKTGVIRSPMRIWVSDDWAARGQVHDAGFPPVPRCAAHLARESALVFRRLDDLPDWPEEREALRRLGIGASAVAILGDAGSHMITLALDSLRTGVDWPENIIPDLRVLGAIVLSALHRKEIENEVEGLRGFARVVSEISSRLVDVRPERADEEIEGALRRVCEHLDADLATLSQWTDPSRAGWMVSHEWLRGASGERLFRGTVIAAEYPWLSARLKDSTPLAICALDEMPPEAAAERATCERVGIQSMLWVPYEAKGTVGGHLVLNTIGRQRSWPDAVLPQLQLAGQLLGKAIAHQQADLALHRAHLEIRSLKNRLEAENRSLREEFRQSFESEQWIGRSHLMQAVLHQVDQVAATNSSVLLLGETGTGKGLIARHIHARSQRADRPLITVNCAALPALLIESELFGHERGAYTGAVARKIGRFELAAGGTLFLDEIGDLPLELQVKLLRVLHDREFERLGSSKTLTSDARIIAATNRKLKKLVEQGLFRSDLYYRLHVFPIHVPPLREHSEDIPLLVWYFIEKLRARLGHQIKTVSPEAMDKLKGYGWPGNVRELHNVLERAIILSSGSTLETASIRLIEAASMPAPVAPRDTGEKTLRDAERDYILRALESCEWKVRGKDGAAERLGLKRTTLNSRMKKLGIRRPTRMVQEG